jgi:hypothetical protein
MTEIKQSEDHYKKNAEFVKPVSEKVRQASMIVDHMRGLEGEEDEAQPESQDGGILPVFNGEVLPGKIRNKF